MASPTVSALLESLATSGKAYGKDEAGSREALIEHSRALIAALEIPSEFIQRSFWAEVRTIPRTLLSHDYTNLFASLLCLHRSNLL